ncbi:GNAT family N-acetyltransferase [Spirillospora albida]|uniref:GNAT family N-acetyltransferase n=1 Tax=Spirillospora albida TaxID=58123 RepID=UPI0004C1C7C3|nr:GNAT family N-acetyltransferase [Spirillospora albida]
MLVDHFPLLGLRLRTPRLELRLPSAEELAALAELAAGGIHDAGVMPFAVPWTDQAPEEVARSVVLHHWRELGAWRPDDWTLLLAVFLDGAVVGVQSVGARDLAVRREVATGSWLGRRYQGQGIGTEMRAAVLHLAFGGLDVQDATSAAFLDNHASEAVSRKLGYRPDGIERHVLRDALVIAGRMRLSRVEWERHRSVAVTVEGLEPCLPLMGVPAS